jgi:uncharacterized damage-inducible protein DinB
MQTLLQLLDYNGWANARVFALCRSVADTLLTTAATGTIGSIEATLKHLVMVEDAYLAMVQELDLAQTLGEREPYLAHDLTWFARRADQVAEQYRALLARQDTAWLDRAMRVPWFDFPMTVRDGILQALTHSALHRSQVLSALGEQGVQVPDIDYVLMVGERRRGASA